MFFVAVNVDGPADLDGCVLEFPVIGCQGAVGIGSCVIDANHGPLVVHEGVNVDTFVLFLGGYRAEQVPEDVGEDIFLGDEAQAAGDAVDDYIVVFAGKGVKTNEQILYELMQGYLDTVGRGLIRLQGSGTAG